MLVPITIAGRIVGDPFTRLWRLASLRARVERGRVPVSTQFDGPVRSDARLRLEFGEHCRLGREVFLDTPRGSIKLGRNVRVNQGTVIVSYTSIEIGDDVLIGEYVTIRDANHGTRVMSPDMPMRKQEHESEAIKIGAGAWIARGACILKGVTIGEGAVVAANSVVTKDVPAMAIAGGVPAKVLKMRSAVPSSIGSGGGVSA
jgi:acetyltransferase-like isoleucine patch superfamily enzyme